MRATFTHLITSKKGERADFAAARISIGRAPDNMLCLGEDARRVSSHHAEVIRRGNEYLLRDLGSTNGTMINGRRVIVGELEQDDLIEFGAGGPLLRFGVEQDEAPAPNEAAGSKRMGDRVPSGFLEPEIPRRGLKNNAALIAALMAAMLLGGIGGIVASSKLRASDAESLSFAEVAELNSTAVVFIRVEFELLDPSGQVTTREARTGSGFVISESGLIITNRHLVRDWEYNSQSQGASGRVTKIEIVQPHQKPEEAVAAEIYKLGPNNSSDVAILKFTSPDAIVHAIEPDINNINQGDEVVVIGYPLGLNLLELTKDDRIDPSLSTGIVSRVGQDFIQLNLRAYRGNSGGPVLNRKGSVIGILTANIGSAQDIALATPISAAVALVRSELESITREKD
jgi:S1-C subfamily serine protease